ncbi:MAG: hypothetical protein A3E88_07720 [Legionellales bacterium RIFCSPHIGHO2_12_FULL_35_11]|nr:MAG: hypothetical protein A3E88_07720 [Legionellales bacterium RIFCSPHIGHO2_12_FULL_35_11]
MASDGNELAIRGQHTNDTRKNDDLDKVYAFAMLGTDTKYTPENNYCNYPGLQETLSTLLQYVAIQQVNGYQSEKLYTLGANDVHSSGILEWLKTGLDTLINIDHSYCINELSDNAAVIDGPSTFAYNIDHIIVTSIKHLLEKCADGYNKIAFTAHSRGAMASIVVAAELDRIQQEFRDNSEMSKENFITLVKSSTHANTSKLLKAYELTDKQFEGIKKSILSLNLHMFLLDPVPGGGFFRVTNAKWDDSRFHSIPQIVKTIKQYVPNSERTRGFKGRVFRVPDSSKVDYTVTLHPGHHGTASGNPSYHVFNKKNFDICDKNKTLGVQELVSYKMIEFYELLGFKPNSVNREGYELNTKLNEFIGLKSEGRSFKLVEVFDSILQNKDAYKRISSTNYGTGNEGGWSRAHYDRLTKIIKSNTGLSKLEWSQFDIGNISESEFNQRVPKVKFKAMHMSGGAFNDEHAWICSQILGLNSHENGLNSSDDSSSQASSFEKLALLVPRILNDTEEKLPITQLFKDNKDKVLSYLGVLVSHSVNIFFFEDSSDDKMLESLINLFNRKISNKDSKSLQKELVANVISSIKDNFSNVLVDLNQSIQDIENFSFEKSSSEEFKREQVSEYIRRANNLYINQNKIIAKLKKLDQEKYKTILTNLGPDLLIPVNVDIGKIVVKRMEDRGITSIVLEHDLEQNFSELLKKHIKLKQRKDSDDELIDSNERQDDETNHYKSSVILFNVVMFFTAAIGIAAIALALTVLSGLPATAVFSAGVIACGISFFGTGGSALVNNCHTMAYASLPFS